MTGSNGIPELICCNVDGTIYCIYSLYNGYPAIPQYVAHFSEREHGTIYKDGDEYQELVFVNGTEVTEQEAEELQKQLVTEQRELKPVPLFAGE